jgi:WD40 repeat protein
MWGSREIEMRRAGKRARRQFFSIIFVWLVSLHSHTFAADPTYWEDVRPILRKHCTACHSARTVAEVEVSGGLALDTYPAMMKTPKKPVVQVGKSSQSALLQLLVEPDEDKRMPRSSARLSEEKIALLRRWIDTGAKEGTRPEESETIAAPVSPRRGRKLDVRLSTTGKLELTLPAGPLAPITAIAFSPDGKLLAAGCYGRVAVWDLTAAQPLRVLTNVLGAVNDVRFSPDGKLLAVAGGQPSAKGDLRLYQVDGWKLLATLGGHEDVVFSVAFRPDGKQLASASFDKTVRLWNLADHKLEKTLTGHSDFVYAVAYAPDGQWLVSASKDRSVKTIEVATGKSLRTFSGMDQDVLALAVSPNGKHVVSSGFESRLYWWNPQTGQRERLQGGHGVAVHELCFSKDGKVLLSAGADRTARIWNGESGAAQRTLSVGSVTYAVGLHPGGTLAATGSYDGLVRLWEVSTGKLRATLLALPPEGERFDWLALAPDGHFTGSPGLPKIGQWRTAKQAVSFEEVGKDFQKPDALVKALNSQ